MAECIKTKYGYVQFHCVLDVADVHHVEILEALRGKGHGTALLACFLAEMKKRGVSSVTLEVRCDNAVAIRLYERAAFVRVAVRKSYYKDGCDAWLMRKDMKEDA